eukprot:m.643186 g.643186  ORF g.643186 m.643186 type:complete len:130 (+) comp58349_c1_seq1:115-504(+)
MSYKVNETEEVPLLGYAAAERKYRVLANKMVKVTILMTVANIIVVVFLCGLIYEYMRADGLKATFYTLKDEFAFAKETIQSMNNTLNQLDALFELACQNIAPNVYEICEGINFEHKYGPCLPWDGKLNT